MLSLKKQITISYTDETTESMVQKFHPSLFQYNELMKIDSTKTNEYIEYREVNTDFHIPEHQRFYVWNVKQQSKFIDTLICNYPIPDIIVSTKNCREPSHVEDGQQRLTTIWRYFHNLFPYMPEDSPNHHIYYSRLPSKQKDTITYSLLGELNLEAKRNLENYRIHIKRIANVGDEQSFEEKISEIFERLQEGKPLADGDKIWNRKEKSIPTVAIRLGLDENLQRFLKHTFNINISKITSSTGKAVSKKPLCTLVGIVLGFCIPTNQDLQSGDRWPGIMTTAYSKVYKYFEIEVTEEYYEVIKLAVKTICEILQNAPVRENEAGSGGKISTNHNSSFNRHLGLMIYDWRIRMGEVESQDDIDEDLLGEYVEFWEDVIGRIQIKEPNLDENEDFKDIYIDGDRPNKNTDIGKNIIQRYEVLLANYELW